MKKLLLLIIPLVLITTACTKKTISEEVQAEGVKQVTGEYKIDKLEVVNFHGANRCTTCRNIERLAKETLDEYFPAELENGKIVFISADVDSFEDQDMAFKFKATGSSIFTNVINDELEDIEQDLNVWRLASNNTKYKDYFKKKITSLLFK